jgi:hypothetical protein
MAAGASRRRLFKERQASGLAEAQQKSVPSNRMFSALSLSQELANHRGNAWAFE